jgi:hypothetical protein
VGLCVGAVIGVGGSVGLYVGVVMGLGSERECGTTRGSGDREWEGVWGHIW